MKRETTAHRDDAVAVLHPAIPGAQPHTLLPELGAHTGLRGKEHGVREQAVCLPQGGFCWSQKVQVPMNSDAVNVLSCLWVCQHLDREGEESWGKGAMNLARPVQRVLGDTRGPERWAVG